MAGSTKQQGPSNINEALDNVAMAVTAAMLTPEAMRPDIHEMLMNLQKATLGAKATASGQGKPPAQPQQAPGGQPPAMQGGGTNLRQLMGGQPSGPSAGMGVGPTSTGMSAEDMRSSMADQAS